MFINSQPEIKRARKIRHEGFWHLNAMMSPRVIRVGVSLVCNEPRPTKDNEEV